MRAAGRGCARLEADAPGLPDRHSDEFAYRSEDGLDRRVVTVIALLEGGETARERGAVFVFAAEADEGPHDVDVHLDRARC